MARQFTALCELSHQINQYCLDTRGSEVVLDVLARLDTSDMLLVVNYITTKWLELPPSARNNLFPPDWLLSQSTFHQAVLLLLRLADFACIWDKDFDTFTAYHSASSEDTDDETPRHLLGPLTNTRSSAIQLLNSPDCPNLSPACYITDSPLSFPLRISQTPSPLVGSYLDTPAPALPADASAQHPVAPRSNRSTAPVRLRTTQQPSFRQPKPKTSTSTSKQSSTEQPPITGAGMSASDQNLNQGQNGDGAAFTNVQM